MSDYISREALKEAFENADADVCESFPDGYCDWGFGRQNIQDVIASVPAADVEPVRHGRWEMVYPDGTFCKGEALRTMYALLVCSECGKTFELMRMGKPRYCTCGAKMDLEGETNDD